MLGLLECIAASLECVRGGSPYCMCIFGCLSTPGIRAELTVLRDLGLTVNLIIVLTSEKNIFMIGDIYATNWVVVGCSWQSTVGNDATIRIRKCLVGPCFIKIEAKSTFGVI